MSPVVNNQHVRAVGGLLSLDGATSTGAGTAYLLDVPLSDWTLGTLIAGATAGTALLEGSAFSSSDAPFSTIMSVTMSTAGENNSTQGFPAKQVRVTLDSASSSAYTAHAAIAGSP